MSETQPIHPRFACGGIQFNYTIDVCVQLDCFSRVAYNILLGISSLFKDTFEPWNDTVDRSHQIFAQGSAPRAGQLRNA